MSTLPALSLGARGELRLTWAFTPTGLNAQLLGAPTPVAPLQLDCQPAGPPFGAVAPWTVSQVPARGPRGEPFLAFRDAVADALFESFRGLPDDAWVKRVGQEQRVLGVLQAGAAHALSLLDGALVPRVRRFHPALRWAVYQALRGDDTGRLLQLADTAPAALSFALTHAQQSDDAGRAAALAFRDAVRGGVPLKRALWPLLEDWAAFGARRRRRRRRGKWDDRPDSFAVLAAQPVPVREARMRQQLVLLRRALPGVGGTLLWLPPPLELVPEDLPRTARAQLRWFKVMKGLAAFAAEGPFVQPARQRAFVRWLSAHAVELSAHKDITPGQLFDHVCRTGRQTPRSLRVERLLAERNDLARALAANGAPAGPLLWPATLREDPYEAQLEELAGPGAEELALPNPVPAVELPGLRVTPLTTATQLRAEGQQMNHCVARYLTAAARGDAWFFHAEVDGAPLTAQVLRVPPHAALSQVYGPSNRAPAPGALQRLHAWWAEAAASLGLLSGTAPSAPPPDWADIPF